MDNLVIINPGMVPGEDDLLCSVISAIAAHYQEEGQWGEKYGIDFENEVFKMHPFCWCEREDCPYCRSEDYGYPPPEPNFHYKPTDLRVSWYKYIRRGMETNRDVSPLELAEVLSKCLSA